MHNIFIWCINHDRFTIHMHVWTYTRVAIFFTMYLSKSKLCIIVRVPAQFYFAFTIDYIAFTLSLHHLARNA